MERAGSTGIPNGLDRQESWTLLLLVIQSLIGQIMQFQLEGISCILMSCRSGIPMISEPGCGDRRRFHRFMLISACGFNTSRVSRCGQVR